MTALNTDAPASNYERFAYGAELTTPRGESMTTEAVTEALSRVARDTPIKDIWAVVERDGGVIIEQLFAPETIAAINNEVDDALAGLNPGAKDEWFNVFFGANTKRFTNVVVASPTFRDTVLQDEVVIGVADEVMTRLSDSYWCQATQVIEIGPGNARQLLHRDMSNYPYFLPLGPDGPEVVINFLIPLTEFREDNGATRVIPGSNRWPDFSDVNEERDQARTIPAEMRPGDALLISGKVLHGGGANQTANEYRRALSFSFNPGMLVPEQAFPFEIPLELARTLPPKTQQILGFRSFSNSKHAGGTLWLSNFNELADLLELD
jgi:ectoine hydroxylase-related dioxygenase (phytanoyl-CoA dioxygenase family)